MTEIEISKDRIGVSLAGNNKLHIPLNTPYYNWADATEYDLPIGINYYFDNPHKIFLNITIHDDEIISATLFTLLDKEGQKVYNFDSIYHLNVPKAFIQDNKLNHPYYLSSLGMNLEIVNNFPPIKDIFSFFPQERLDYINEAIKQYQNLCGELLMGTLSFPKQAIENLGHLSMKANYIAPKDYTIFYTLHLYKLPSSKKTKD